MSDANTVLWRDRVIELCDQIAELTLRISYLKKKYASKVICKWWRKIFVERRVLIMKDVCLELRSVPGLGIDYFACKRRFEMYQFTG